MSPSRRPFQPPFPPSRPRPVAGGVKARAARGAIGESWWSRRFVDVLESFALGTRLTRGRAYARKGQVMSLEVSPGEVAASVQGSRPTPYRVRIGLDVFDELVWARVEIALAEEALHSAKLLAGEVPPELEQVFADAGAPLFPSSVRQLHQSCSCPDAAVPCKHLAATFYLLAESFDADPFLILRWRGRDRPTLLARLRALRGDGGAAGGAPATTSPTGTAPSGPATLVATAGTMLALADLQENEHTGPPHEFWMSAVPLPEPPRTLDVDPTLLLRQLPAPGRGLGGESLTRRLVRCYERFAATEAP